MQNRNKVTVYILEEGIVRIDHVHRIILKDGPWIRSGNNILYGKRIPLIADHIVRGQDGPDIAEQLL